MNIKACFACALLAVAACATGPLDYESEAPVALRGTAEDSLQTLAAARAGSLGLTVYRSDAAIARMMDVGIGVVTSSDFIYADHPHGCAWLFCKQIDFVVVIFRPADDGEHIVVHAGTYKRPALLADWRLVHPSDEIQADADSLTATFGRPAAHVP